MLIIVSTVASTAINQFDPTINFLSNANPNINNIDNITNPQYNVNVVKFIVLKSNTGDDNATKVLILNCSSGELINDISFLFIYMLYSHIYI
jgi:hypothetical protein